jgi:beta-lactamase class D
MYKDDPKGWFMGLPFQYHGTYLYARMVPDGQKKKKQSKRPRVETSANTADKP